MLGLCLALLVFGIASLRASILPVLMALTIVPFACVIVLRALTLWTILRPCTPDSASPQKPLDDDLPAYTALVPLNRESAVIPQLIRALKRLDYPAGKLEILLIIEDGDQETSNALAGAELAPNMRTVTVPSGAPRTKPRALNYALQESSGDYVVVYDAEDEPDADQLRKAVSAFRAAGPKLGCVQSHLKIYNATDTLLTRQFAIEYAALFGCILPALQHFGLPITLGGTSNHFPRSVLIASGCWDPYNVTEDADLGIRLARIGWQVAVLQSATWEEAPPGLATWFQQRTRWLKGWMQTLIVHTRQPRHLARELGLRRVTGFIVLMTGMVLSALVHPWFYALIAAQSLGVAFVDTNGSELLWHVGYVNLFAGYAISATIAAIGGRRAGYRGLAGHIAFIPFYWLLISAAAYRALYELVVSPHHWHKTPHFGRGRARNPC